MRIRATGVVPLALLAAGVAAAATAPIQVRSAATARLVGAAPEVDAGTTLDSAGDVDGDRVVPVPRS